MPTFSRARWRAGGMTISGAELLSGFWPNENEGVLAADLWQKVRWSTGLGLFVEFLEDSSILGSLLNQPIRAATLNYRLRPPSD